MGISEVKALVVSEQDATKMPPPIAVTLRLPENLKAEADAYAESLGLSLNALLAVSLREYLDRRRPPGSPVVPPSPALPPPGQAVTSSPAKSKPAKARGGAAKGRAGSQEKSSDPQLQAAIDAARVNRAALMAGKVGDSQVVKAGVSDEEKRKYHREKGKTSNLLEAVRFAQGWKRGS